MSYINYLITLINNCFNREKTYNIVMINIDSYLLYINQSTGTDNLTLNFSYNFIVNCHNSLFQ